MRLFLFVVGVMAISSLSCAYQNSNSSVREKVYDVNIPYGYYGIVTINYDDSRLDSTFQTRLFETQDSSLLVQISAPSKSFFTINWKKQNGQLLNLGVANTISPLTNVNRKEDAKIGCQQGGFSQVLGEGKALGGATYLVLEVIRMEQSYDDCEAVQAKLAEVLGR
ncbi:hypothetical protein [Pontibacter sp. G13]|uniref:hypothetical protein n=1 Tax=Pontibacter sp. G13 TaxID=3074898 RepID=UPI00288B7A39|nr:hypothetical protein [Pontibacter sp. G13]WNJ17198.1 hypothetical protein RJD25_20270 [Pontibacter sp. G13]